MVGEWPAYRVSTTHVMTMQHRLYDCYWQMRMPELELGSEVERGADLLSRQQGQGRRHRRPRTQALIGRHSMRITRRSRHPRIAARYRSLPSSRLRSTRQRADAAIKVGVSHRTRRLAVAARAGRNHAAMLGPPEQSTEERCRGDPAAREGDDRIPRRRQDGRRLEERRSDRPIGLRSALHRLSAAIRERRQLLRLPPAHQARGELRHARAAACSQYGKIRNFREADDQDGVREDLQFTARRFHAPTCRASAPTRS